MLRSTRHIPKNSNSNHPNKMAGIQKLKRPDTLTIQALERIRESLANGGLERDKVYSSNYFAKVLGISRTPAREALLQLTSEGYFTSLLGRGFRMRQFTEKDIHDFFETRRLIETYIIRHLDDLLTDDLCNLLKENLKQMMIHAEKPDVYQFLDVDKVFHMILVDRYDNAQFATIMENIRNLMTIMGVRALTSSGRINEVISEHQSIIEALIEKDIDRAVEEMTHHINTTEKTVLNEMIF
jgi:DNA-binding GntR family transcriptional regulator